MVKADVLELLQNYTILSIPPSISNFFSKIFFEVIE